jgi:tRNA-(ms[2]io[6]A)-hydroxylase
MSNLNYDELMQPVIDFLGCTTPQAWLDEAVNHLDILMQDHANCEKRLREQR